MLLDADAITSFQEDPALFDSAITGARVMTPHDGEFRHLFDLGRDKLTRTRAASPAQWRDHRAEGH